MLTKPFQKILVGIDGSDKSVEAADYSISIAKNTNAQLIILNVLEGRMVISDLVTSREVHSDSVDAEAWCSLY